MTLIRHRMKMQKGRMLWMALVALFGMALVAYGQSAVREDINDLNKATSILDPANGAGIFVAGNLWDSFLPPNVGPYYSEATQPIIGTFTRIGNFDRAWSSPTHMWPGGWTNGNYWGKGFYLTEFNPDTLWNPPTIGGAANPSYKAASGASYAFASFKTTVAGANVAARNYKKEVYWTDASRHHAVYEAGWPTTIGVDVKMKIHQFTLHWNGFDDFIIVEVTLTNTGNLDMNADGTVEKTGNKIRALTMLAHGEFMCSYFLTNAAGRGNRFGANRAIGYVGDNDPKGNPWDMMIGYPGESVANAKDMGLNDFPMRFYTDVWSGWSWLAVKSTTPTTPSEQLGAMPDKTTLYGTHPIGVGPQRGWWISGGQGRGIGVGAGGNLSDPKRIHTASMGTYYKDGGKSRDATKFDFSPNPKFFDSGTLGDPTTFVPKAGPYTEATRPNGDRKLFSMEDAGAFEVNTWESGWTKGFTGPNNFDGDMFSAVGPFSLDVGESITIVWAEVGGFRLQGVANAMAAARWAFENGYGSTAGSNVLDNYPAVPTIRVDNTLSKSTKIRWDNKANTGSGFAGYKIYRAAQAKQIDWLDGGMRAVDDYWKNTTPGSTPSSLLKPINPNFAAQSFVAGRMGVPDSWGPYELIAYIPSAQLTTYADNSVTGYNYSYEDKTVELGFKYWYYVAAYTSGSYDLGANYSGLGSPTINSIETSNVNRNGATGLWQNTYPFAELNTFFPKTADGQRAMGAGFVVKSALANPADLARGAAKVSVKPNPYKKKALFDSAIDAFDHKVTFYNLPPSAKITILDVSGQVVQQINFSSSDPNNGSVFWNLFSKDGIEVASGLYIYVVDYTGGQQVGYLSILR